MHCYCSRYDKTVFDEICVSDLCVLNNVRFLIQDNPDKMVVPTGGVKQLQGVEMMTNCQNPATYMDDCLDILFKHKIYIYIYHQFVKE